VRSRFCKRELRASTMPRERFCPRGFFLFSRFLAWPRRRRRIEFHFPSSLIESITLTGTARNNDRFNRF
jgi:hypothetical protein